MRRLALVPAMTARFTSCGKQVLRDGEHFGDMMTAEDAALVARLLNGRDDRGNEEPNKHPWEALSFTSLAEAMDFYRDQPGYHQVRIAGQFCRIAIPHAARRKA